MVNTYLWENLQTPFSRTCKLLFPERLEYGQEAKVASVFFGNESRRYAKALRKSCTDISDSLDDEQLLYLNELQECTSGEYIILDTETTGLDVLNDDIVEIAAFKIKQGVIVDEFTVFLKSDKSVPLMLGDVKNPLVEELKVVQLCDRKQALLNFMKFANGLPLIGHNVEYDYQILDNNLKRDCEITNLSEMCPVYFDTLKASLFLFPQLRMYRLKFLLEIFKLEGKNSHLATDDIVATKSLLDYCLQKFGEYKERH